MILWNRTQIMLSSEREVLSTELTSIVEGHALVGAYEGGITKVKRSTATTSETFLGFAMAPRRAFNTQKGIETITPTSTAAISLKKTALGAIGAVNNTTGAIVVVSAGAVSPTNIQSAAAGGVTTLAFDATMVGVVFTIIYDYTSNSQEESYLVSDYAGAFPTEVLAKVGVIYSGIVYTDRYLTNGNFGAGTITLKSVATGLIDTSAGTGSAITNGELLSAPTYDIPYLGVRLR